MENKFTSSEKIGEIVSRFPKASDVFKRYGIDFCCGGNRPLLEAIKENDLDEEEIIRALDKAYIKASTLQDKNIDWRTAPLSDLIDYIVATHHSYLQRELPQLSELTVKILRVHGSNHGELAKVHRLFSSLRMDLEEHLIKEEEVVFPLIKQYEKEFSSEDKSKAINVIKELESEHTGAGDIIKELRHITGHFVAPEDACSTFERAYQKLEELESDLFQHIHLENNILFPRFEGK